MKKITFFKTLLVAAGLLGGSNAWADDVYTILYGTATYTDETVTGVSPQTDFTSDDGSTASDITHSDGNGDNCTNAMPVGGSVLSTNPSFTHYFATAATKGIVHFEANYTTPAGNTTTSNSQAWKIVDSNGVVIFGSTSAGQLGGNGNADIGFCNDVSLGTGWYRQARSAHNRVVLDINLSTKIVSYTILYSSGNNSYSTATGTYDLPAAVSDVKGLTGTVKGGYVSYMDYVSFYNVYDDAASETAYTINWVCNETTVKTTTRNGTIGSTITLLDTDDDSFFVGETKYMYSSDDADGQTVAEDGSAVVTITVTEAAVYNYTVNAVDASENVLAVLASSSVYEDDNSVTTRIPWYVLNDGTLYYQGSNSNTTSITEDGQVVNITYVENKTNVVYYSEAENISGGTGISLTNGSNYAGARALSNVNFTTLEAGKYKIYSRFAVGNGTAGSTYATNPFTVGETALEYNVPAKTNTDYTSEEFVVTASTNLYVNFSGSSISGVDYIYIQKTGDVQTLTSSSNLQGYKTFYNATKNFEVDANTTIYKAAAPSNGYVTITAVEGSIIPADTPVFLKTTDTESYAITLTETDEEGTGDFTGNALQAAEEDGKIDGAYILAYTTADGLGIYQFTGSLDAGDVYLTAAGQGAKLRFGFADDATAIKTVAVEAADNAVIYNVAGQRVNAAYKGIVIKNGKKYLNK